MLCFDITMCDVRIRGEFLINTHDTWRVEFHDNMTANSQIKELTSPQVQALVCMSFTSDNAVSFPENAKMEEIARGIIDGVVGYLPVELRPYPCSNSPL